MVRSFNQLSVEAHIRQDASLYHHAMAAIHGRHTLKAAVNDFMRKHGNHRLRDGTIMTNLAVYRAMTPMWEKVKGQL